MNFHVISLFPESLTSYLEASILARAIADEKISITTYPLRQYVTGRYRKVWPDGNVSAIADDRPVGGGPGMVLRAEPILKAVEVIKKSIASYELKITKKNPKYKSKIKIVFFAPAGKQFDTAYAKNAAKKYTDIIFICGRYEGVDARVKKILKAEEVSIGPYVVTGGELPALVMMDSIARQVPEVLGRYDSLEEERVSSSEIYTRPEVLEYDGKKYKVPAVLLSGDHKKIEEWKKSR